MSTRDKNISFRVDGGDIQLIPASQDAHLLRFLWQNLGKKLPWDALYRALNRSPEVNRCLHSLRHKWGVPIECDMVPKASGKGRFGLHYLGEGVEVIDEGGRHAS